MTRVSFPWCPPAQLARALGISLSELAEASAGMPRRFALFDDAEIDTVCEHLGRRRPCIELLLRVGDAGAGFAGGVCAEAIAS